MVCLLSAEGYLGDRRLPETGMLMASRHARLASWRVETRRRVLLFSTCNHASLKKLLFQSADFMPRFLSSQWCLELKA
ncbi:hypothetical protein RRG08_048849 [Elysia crispata]|uniref:Uncharacterized protein n=1 Tax=Elysia crispata TaxID=231223 RepID=A0AAE1AJX7_9GAST|nr:hypothetical protein RRG08_048849 [Elysia crispata]